MLWNSETAERILKFMRINDNDLLGINEGTLRLARLGWSIPINFPPRIITEIGASDSSEKDISDYMSDFYLDNNAEQLSELINKTLVEDQDLGLWKETIIQAKEAFDRQLYIVTVLSLLVVVEGNLAKKVGTFSTNNVRLISPTTLKANQNHKIPIDTNTWFSIQTIVEQLYEKKDFSEVEPGNLNRHWAIHGRYVPNEAKVDALKLFNLLGSLTITEA